MRALAAILILLACTQHAQTTGLKTVTNLFDCTFAIGPGKCLNALTAWRAQRAIQNPDANSNLTADLEQFPWTKYRNDTDEELYSEVCKGTEQLLRRRSLTLTFVPGYKMELLSKGNGTLSVDVYETADQSSRGMKKTKKKLAQFLPLLVLPGLIISAILPFVLPALKLMVVGVGMINNMALSGAVFTLLRNNAFNDNYKHRIIYVNEGYKNEKHKHTNHDYGKDDFDNYQFAESSNPSAIDIPEIETIQELPLGSDWIKQYYGNGENVEIFENDQIKIKRGDRRKEPTN